MNTDYDLIFWLLVFSASIIVLAIAVLAKVISDTVRNEDYIKLVHKKQTKNAEKVLSILVLIACSPAAFAAAKDAEVLAEPMFNLTDVLMMAGVNVALLGVLWFIKNTHTSLVAMALPDVEKKEEVQPVTSKITQILTGIVSIEEEHTILMDHEYDGIQELDNNLPPWWKWGFYLSIVVSVLYMLNYHVFGFSDLQEDAYVKEMKQADDEVAAFLANSALNVDEHSVTTLKDIASLTKGASIFVTNCAVCHLKDGGGQTGPNMTDDYWIYGSGAKDIFKTVKYGAKRGMTAWQKKLTPVQIQQVTSYVRSLHGTTPEVAKEPEGKLDPFVEEEAPTEEASPEIENNALPVDSLKASL